ncbi:UrcA family protein [Maricaulis sp.]|uniref:UrcA family protein n=1 Tax=Maricaulis sp. TaxID=1486257 RepID=UPI002B266D87|nr:UrcA family protein [Maricaulis sp.]
MKRALLNALVLLTLGTATIALPPSSQAQSSPAPQTDIAFESADLIDPARFDTLQDRIKTAARDVCREALVGDLLRPVTMRSCIRDTTQRAIDQLAEHRMTVLAATNPTTTDPTAAGQP